MFAKPLMSLAIASLIALPAFAGTQFTAQLATPKAERERVVAASAVWICEGETCTAELKSSKISLKACKGVAAEIGALTSFASANAEMDADDLAKCNQSARN
jgi:hypothetical protein